MAAARPTKSAGTASSRQFRATLSIRDQSIVVMPVNASLTKIEACRDLGAMVVLQGSTLEEARQAAEGIAAERGASFIHPCDDWEIIAGQAGVGLEILEALPDAAQIVAPWRHFLGDGGTSGGIQRVFDAPGVLRT